MTLALVLMLLGAGPVDDVPERDEALDGSQLAAGELHPGGRNTWPHLRNVCARPLIEREGFIRELMHQAEGSP